MKERQGHAQQGAVGEEQSEKTSEAGPDENQSTDEEGDEF